MIKKLNAIKFYEIAESGNTAAHTQFESQNFIFTFFSLKKQRVEG